MTQSLPFVHTARRYYRLGVPVRALDWRPLPSGKRIRRKEVRTGALRGSKSRNKVSVGEPAEGSLLNAKCNHTRLSTTLSAASPPLWEGGGGESVRDILLELANIIVASRALCPC